MHQTRQLAAIMFTDIVGYTSLMGRDEERAFELLNRNRQLQKPIISQFNGRWIKELGDGVMASFDTVSDAVNAAIAIQSACNATEDYRLRIGIHLGEVVFEDGDVFGDGVNIASRIQGIAHPGSIFVSESVHTNTRNKKDITTEFLRTVNLKNVKDPVRIYQVIADAVVAAPPAKGGAGIRVHQPAWMIILAAIVLLGGAYFLVSILRDPGRTREANYIERSIAVLPFTDMSPEKDQGYLGDGLAEEIINSISIIKDLKVIGRTSSFQFKGKSMDAKEIGEKLDANYLLEGSIRKSGNNLRITSQLIRVNDNVTIWSQRFENALKDIFEIQDSIANMIVEKLRVTLSDSERPRLAKKVTDPEVYSLYLKGLYTYKENNFEKCIEYNLQALASDSTFAPSYAYIALARTWQINRNRAFSDFAAIREAKEYANRAIQYDPDLAEGYSALGLLAWTVEIDFAPAKRYFEKSIQLNPSASLTRNRYGYFLLWMGDFDKAEAMGLEAISNDPADFNGYFILTWANMMRKHFDKAKQYIMEARKLFPALVPAERLDIQVDFFSGEYGRVVDSIEMLLRKEPIRDSATLLGQLSISYDRIGRTRDSRNILQMLNGMATANASNAEYAMARIYCHYRMKDSCFNRLERSLQKREINFRLLKIDPILDPIKMDPRYLDLLHRYGFDKYSP